MKIQNLAVIFIIIILPISMLLNAYTKNQMRTLNLQMSYDIKLNNSTYDALKAFQLNTINSSTSDLANSKLRDIEASVNTFFNSISTNFNMVGYNQNVLRDYVPALVYTMYDGFYIYSSYRNTLTNVNYPEEIDPSYINNERLSGLKPYIYYSSRYVNSNVDVVISYSLDNYVTIQGIVDGKTIYKDGYLLDEVEIRSNGDVYYRGIKIDKNEGELKEVLIDPDTGNMGLYTYTKVNGVKYYYESSNNSWFYIMNGVKHGGQPQFDRNNNSAYFYYKEAAEFKSWINSTSLQNLRTTSAVDGNNFVNNRVFDFTSLEEPDSNFNQHRLEVIRYSIEKNLSIAIANYNNYANGIKTDFQMPRLREDEWEKILNNVSIISFLQGLNIGGKVYNGYSIINNNKNEEVVNEDSIYMITNDNQYHNAISSELTNSNIVTGALNTDFERKSMIDVNTGTIMYYYPRPALASYTSVISQSSEVVKNNHDNNIYKYMESIKSSKESVVKAYFIALRKREI